MPENPIEAASLEDIRDLLDSLVAAVGRVEKRLDEMECGYTGGVSTKS